MRGERLGRRDSRETYRTKEWPGGENGSVYPVGAMMGEDPMLFPMGAPRHPLHQQVHPQLGGMREYEQDNKTKRAFPRGMPPAPPPDPVNITDLYSASGRGLTCYLSSWTQTTPAALNAQRWNDITENSTTVIKDSEQYCRFWLVCSSSFVLVIVRAPSGE